MVEANDDDKLKGKIFTEQLIQMADCQRVG
jgi:hypothetical protein